MGGVGRNAAGRESMHTQGSGKLVLYTTAVVQLAGVQIAAAAMCVVIDPDLLLCTHFGTDAILGLTSRESSALCIPQFAVAIIGEIEERACSALP